MSTRERPPKPYESAVASTSTALTPAASSRGLRPWEREAALGNQASASLGSFDSSSTSSPNSTMTTTTASQPPVPGNGSRPPAASSLSSRTWERSNGRYSPYGGGGYEDDYYGGNYSSYGNRYGSYGGGYGSRYGSYGGYGGYAGYGGYGYDDYDKYGRMGPYGRFGNRALDQGFSWVGNVQSVTDGFGRFASLLDANSQAMHGMLSSIIRLIDNVGMLYKEIGFFISGFTIIRLLTRLFRRVLGRKDPAVEGQQALVPSAGFDVSEFSSKQGGAATDAANGASKGSGWAGFLATIALICMGIPAIVYLFRRAARALRELDAATGGPPLEEPEKAQGPAGRVRVRALYDYTPQGENELSMREGDVIRVLAKINDDWWEGEIEGRKGFIGIFPSNYVEVLPPLTQRAAEPLDPRMSQNDYMRFQRQQGPMMHGRFDEEFGR